MTTGHFSWHSPVMSREVVEFLKCRPDGFYVDGTLGGGGHAEEILKATSPSGRLLGIDRDLDAVEFAKERLKIFGKRVWVVHGLFSHIDEIMSSLGVKHADGILLDLGVSSYQLDTDSRGFSFRGEALLDMRMDKTSGESLLGFLNQVTEEELADVIYKFGEERFSRRIAREIIRRRIQKQILTTKDLADVVAASIPQVARRNKKIHPATKTFQALRIFLNNELDELHQVLETAPRLLSRTGRLVVISYHSLEDRLVKRSFKAWKDKKSCEIITKKVVVPSDAEVVENPRARSAKLRTLERVL